MTDYQSPSSPMVRINDAFNIKNGKMNSIKIPSANQKLPTLAKVMTFGRRQENKGSM